MTTKEIRVQLALGTLSYMNKLKLANNKRTTKRILFILSTDENEYVRYWTAFNSNTSVDALKILSKDKDWSIRCNIAYNPNTPIDILKKLSKDKDSSVRDIAVVKIMKLKGKW